MAEQDLAQRRAWLERMESRIRERFDVSQTEYTHALSAYDNHPADQATETFRRELDVGLTVGLNRQLADVHRAQEKIDEGTYGLCDRCGAPISEGRLEAIPEAVLCLRCQEGVEESYVPPPSEAEVVPFPFGDRRDIHRDVVEADGEDFWQSVAQFGTSDSPQDTPPAVDYFETFVGFEEPIGYVQDVESIVDENGEVLLDAVRQKPIRNADSTDAESDQYPD